jgi:hypothetical protein
MDGGLQLENIFRDAGGEVLGIGMAMLDKTFNHAGVVYGATTVPADPLEAWMPAHLLERLASGWGWYDSAQA